MAALAGLPTLVDASPKVLSKLHVPEGATLEVQFNAVAANIPAEATFFSQPKEGTPLTWLICYARNLTEAPKDAKVLAEVKHQSGELSFQWRTPIEDLEARKELSNCLLQVTCENASQTMALRTPAELPRVVLDLNREVATYSLPAADLPKEERLHLELAELFAFPGGATIRDDRRTLKLKERAVIQFQDVPGAEIQIEFRRQVSGELQVVMRPEFRENAAEKLAMTLQRLAGLKDGMEKAIPRSEARIVALGKQLRALDDQIKNMGPRPEGPAFIAWQSKMRGLQSDASSARGELARLQRKLPEMKARLAAVPQMQRFLSDLHQKAALTLRVYAECGDAKLLLVDARLDPASPSRPPGS